MTSNIVNGLYPEAIRPWHSRFYHRWAQDSLKEFQGKPVNSKTFLALRVGIPDSVELAPRVKLGGYKIYWYHA